jgi:hypothetical protein
VDGKRLRVLRERAFEAGILGSSEMNEHELLTALGRTQSGRTRRSLFGLRSIRPAGRR